METNFKKLVGMCEDELINREYGSLHLIKIRAEWEKLGQWMQKHQYAVFSESIGIAYCDEVLGGHIMSPKTDRKNQIRLRSVRMLISYQKDGDFEFRTPSIEWIFTGEIGRVVESYLTYATDILLLSPFTISGKRQYLHQFHVFLNDRSLTLDDLNVDIIETFFKNSGMSLASMHNSRSAIRIFLRYAYDCGAVKKDVSLFVLTDNYRKDCKLPTTYEESEIRSMIASVERSSAIGKRDYLILLLASEYGWRSKDITEFSFSQIDWDKNVIRFNQSKTEVPVEYPLLSSIGNAVIDYLKHGRPPTDAEQIIVGADTTHKGRPLTSPTIHSIVTKYMRKANIENWKVKKHGAHSLRHSLATNMLKNNISLPVISTVLGHQNTESTKVYLAVDEQKLRLCPLPMPELHSIHFEWEVK